MIIKKTAAVLRKHTIIPILFLFFLVASLLTNRFFTIGNFRNILTQCSINGIIALGATYLALNGYRDLSVGTVMGLSAALVIKLQPLGTWLGIGVAVIVSLIVGLINGFLVVKVGINTFIATLATMLICRGSMYLYTDGRPLSGVDMSFADFGAGSVLGIPNLFIVFMSLLLLSYFILRYTNHGRSTYASGGNAESASHAGINVKRTSMINFVICSFCACLGGILMASRTYSFFPNMGWPDTHFMVIVMVVLGGTKMIGGIGNVFYTLGGVLVLAIFQNVFNLLHINPFYNPLFTGLILIGTLYIDSVIKPGSAQRTQKLFWKKKSKPIAD